MRIVIGFLSERLLNVCLPERNVKIKEEKVVFLEEQNWLKTSSKFLKKFWSKQGNIMDNNQPIRVLQAVVANDYGGLTSYVCQNYRHINKNNVQFDFIMVLVYKNGHEKFNKLKSI